jgi:hypothetical protein
MNWKSPAAIAACAVLAAALALPAEAAPRKKVKYVRAGGGPPTVVITRDEDGKTRTKLIVTPRSYLDGGTEVLPGQRKYSDYATQPFWSPIDILGPGRGYERAPLPDRIEGGRPIRF